MVLHNADPFLLKAKGAEARTCVQRGSDTYITIYDAKVVPYTRVRWTLAHELGHIVLGHLKDFEQTAINRGGILAEEYDVLEKEADFFAAELLEPMAILKEVGAWRAEEITQLCWDSKTAAENRAKDLSWWGCTKLACEDDQDLKRQFSLYLSWVCVCADPTRIPIKTAIVKNPRRRTKVGKHLFIRTDENGRFLECPRCGNTEFSPNANFCKMCGLYLYNQCGEIPQYDHTEYDEHLNVIGGVHRINPGDARYCEHCGRETLLTRLGLLMTWEEVQKAYGTIAAGLQTAEEVDESIEEEPAL